MGDAQFDFRSSVSANSLEGVVELDGEAVGVGNGGAVDEEGISLGLEDGILGDGGEVVVELLDQHRVVFPAVAGGNLVVAEGVKRVGPLGIPQILVPACVDFSVHHTTSISDEFKNRPIYDHNPEFALARCTKEEMGTIGAYFAECANTSKGPVEIVIPGEGYSIPNVPGGVFWDRDADATFEAALMKNINPEIPVEKLPLHANSDEFGIAVAQRFLSLISVREK
mgnify:CR=1 FL=1